MPLGYAAKIQIAIGDIDRNGVETVEKVWYYKWYRGLHCLCGLEWKDLYKQRSHWEANYHRHGTLMWIIGVTTMRQLLRPSVVLPTEPSGTAQGFGTKIPYSGVVSFRHEGIGQQRSCGFRYSVHVFDVPGDQGGP